MARKKQTKINGFFRRAEPSRPDAVGGGGGAGAGAGAPPVFNADSIIDSPHRHEHSLTDTSVSSFSLPYDTQGPKVSTPDPTRRPAKRKLLLRDTSEDNPTLKRRCLVHLNRIEEHKPLSGSQKPVVKKSASDILPLRSKTFPVLKKTKSAPPTRRDRGRKHRFDDTAMCESDSDVSSSPPPSPKIIQEEIIVRSTENGIASKRSSFVSVPAGVPVPKKLDVTDDLDLRVDLSQEEQTDEHVVDISLDSDMDGGDNVDEEGEWDISKEPTVVDICGVRIETAVIDQLQQLKSSHPKKTPADNKGETPQASPVSVTSPPPGTPTDFVSPPKNNPADTKEKTPQASQVSATCITASPPAPTDVEIPAKPASPTTRVITAADWGMGGESSGLGSKASPKPTSRSLSGPSITGHRIRGSPNCPRKGDGKGKTSKGAVSDEPEAATTGTRTGSTRTLRERGPVCYKDVTHSFDESKAVTHTFDDSSDSTWEAEAVNPRKKTARAKVSLSNVEKVKTK